jgi:hypothetical protein
LQPETNKKGSALATGLKFLADNQWIVLCVSALVIVPCLWHRHIEAGDLGSHVYNAWLAQLIGKGQASGLYLAWQWNNVLFDVVLLHVANVAGFAAAEKIVVSLCVLIFFWGVFAFVSAVTGRPPWLLSPCIAMLGYGYSFNMGFLNYYLSIGLGCFSLALLWSKRRRNWVAAFVPAGLAYVAHPIGFLWTLGTIGYVAIRRALPAWWKLALPLAALALLLGLRAYLHTRPDMQVDWTRSMPVYQANGADQLILYGDRYVLLAWAALLVGVIYFVVGLRGPREGANATGSAVAAVFRRRGLDDTLTLSVELYFVAFATTALLPENLRVSMYAAWVGLLVSRLTTLSAIFGLCVLGSATPRKLALAGFSAVAAAYFLFLYQDTAALNRMESSAESLLASVPTGTRIIPTIAADPEWRIEFIGHLADRACIEHCFVYSNYEPSSRQFRVRVAPGGSWIVTNSSDDAEDMQGGAYEIDAGDLPVKQLYQCDPHDWTKLCLRDLAAGQTSRP